MNNEYIHNGRRVFWLNDVYALACFADRLGFGVEVDLRSEGLAGLVWLRFNSKEDRDAAYSDISKRLRQL